MRQLREILKLVRPLFFFFFFELVNSTSDALSHTVSLLNLIRNFLSSPLDFLDRTAAKANGKQAKGKAGSHFHVRSYDWVLFFNSVFSLAASFLMIYRK
jgi:hypothetical protein